MNSRGSRRPAGAVRATRRARAMSRTQSVAEAVAAPKFTGRAFVLLGVLVLLAASYTSVLHAWWDQRSEINARRAEIVMRREAIKNLENTQQRYDDPAFIKQQARERFGWVMPGEVGYRVIGVDGKIRGDVPAPPELYVPKARHWNDRLWDSVVAAGREPRKSHADEVLRE